jgi:hypothetical protein
MSLQPRPRVRLKHFRGLPTGLTALRPDAVPWIMAASMATALRTRIYVPGQCGELYLSKQIKFDVLRAKHSAGSASRLILW